MKDAINRNWKLYCCEALGLAIFMASACFFGAMLEGDTDWHKIIPNVQWRNVLTGILMGLTALFILYSPYTSPSGSHINPAVTLTYLKLGQIQKWDALFYILFQVTGGTIAVFIMSFVIGETLTSAPVNYVVTIPHSDIFSVFLAEFLMAFLMMTMILFSSSHSRLKKFTRLFASIFVCAFVIVAGPISGFGMNPARSLASAIPSNTWTSFWIYVLVPIAGMLSAAELFIRVKRFQSGGPHKGREVCPTPALNS